MIFTVIELVQFLIIIGLLILIVYNRKYTSIEVNDMQNSYNILFKESIENKKTIYFLMDLLANPPVSFTDTGYKKESFEVHTHGITYNKIKVDGKWTKVVGSLFYFSSEEVYISSKELKTFNERNYIPTVEELIKIGKF